MFLLCLKAEAPAHPWLLWETSLHRRGAVGIAIYAVALVFLYSINAENAVLSALVPVVAYFLSTLTLPFLKGMWMKNVYKK